MNVQLWSILLLNIIISILGQVLMKNALLITPIDQNNLYPSLYKLLLSWRLIVAIICYFLNLILYLLLLSRLKLGYIFTMQVSLAIIGVTIAGILFFKDMINIKIIIGIVLIISGIVFLNI